jgi:hypothetical protein
VPADIPPVVGPDTASVLPAPALEPVPQAAPAPSSSDIPTTGLIVAAPAAGSVALQVGEGVDGVYLALGGLALLGALAVIGVRVLGA